MGFSDMFSSGRPAPKISSDGAPIAPDRTQRARCWEARDDFFRCLDREGIVDSVTEKSKATKVCGPEGKRFDANCAESWVVYFKKRRVMEHKRDETMAKLKAEGALEVPSDSPILALGQAAQGRK